MEEKIMRTIFRLTAAAAMVVAAVSCAKESPVSIDSEIRFAEKTFTFYTADQKTAYDGASTVTWSKGDLIQVFDTAGNVDELEVEADAATVTLTTTKVGDGPYYAAVNGHASFKDGVMTVAPDATGTFSSADVLYSSSASTSMQFHHAFGFVKIESSKQVEALHLAFADGVAYGSYNLTFSAPGATPEMVASEKDNDYVANAPEGAVYFPVAAGELEGFLVTIKTKDGKYWQGSTDSKLTASAGKVINLKDIDSKLSEIKFYESFDKAQSNAHGGNGETFNGSQNSSIVTDNTWTLVGASMANKCLKFGTASTEGSATTPALGITGSATITFRAASWAGDKADLGISVLDGKGVLDVEKIVNLPDSKFTTYTVKAAGLEPASKIKFSGMTGANKPRVFLDEVSVKEGADDFAYIKLEQESVSLEGEAGEFSIYVLANDGTVSVSSSDPVNFAPAYDAATGALKVTYTEAAAARNATITVSGATLSRELAISQAAAGSLASGTVLWAEDFGSEGTSQAVEKSDGFSVCMLVSEYKYSGRSGYKDNATSVTYSADASNNARVSTQTSGAVVGSNIWLNKKTDATFQTSAIKLYGATACVFSFVQGGSSSAATVEYSADGGSSWTKIRTTNNAGTYSDDVTFPAGTESVNIRITHPKSNDKNTRIDFLCLKVK